MEQRTDYMVEKLHEMTDTIRKYADEIDRDAIRLAETGNWEHVSFAANHVSNMMGNLRLDLLVTVPIREISRQNSASGK